MNIGVRLKISALVSLLALCVVGLALGWLSLRMEEESQEAAVADEVVKEMGELRNLAFEYFHFANARAKGQWEIQYRHLADHFQEGVFSYPEERAIVDRTRGDYEAVGTLFFRIVELREKGRADTRAIAIANEQEALLINSFLIRSMSVVHNFYQLAAEIRETEKRSRETLDFLILTSVAAMAVGMIAVTLVFARSVAKPIARLQEGTEIIGSGDLDYRVGTDARDEIGQLSRAFDRMSGSLKKITASRDELEKEIAARETAETQQRALLRDLERTNGELEQRLSEIKTLRGLLPICSYCKKIRDDKGYWNQIEGYVTEHSEALFSHGICPACMVNVRKEIEEVTKGRNES